jgi:hypothetical protein
MSCSIKSLFYAFKHPVSADALLDLPQFLPVMPLLLLLLLLHPFLQAMSTPSALPLQMEKMSTTALNSQINHSTPCAASHPST